MMMITSKAGARLAKAKARRDGEQMAHCCGGDNFAELRDARLEFGRAAEALADELIANGYHDLDGGEG